MSLAHSRLRIDVIIRRTFTLPKIHTPARPIRPESTGLNTLQLNLPLRLHLHRHRLRKTLHGKLARIVNTKRRHTDLPTNRRHLLNQAPLRTLRSHHLESAPGHVEQAEEVDLHLLADLALAERLELAAQPIASVVADDVEAAELGERGVEGGVDGGFGGDVEVDGEVVGGGGGGEGELRAVAGGGDNVVAAGEDLFDVFVAAGKR